MRADLLAAYRSLTASKTFTAVAVAVLAVGIGASSAIYSVADAVMFRQLPFADADRLVTVKESRPPAPADEAPPVSPQNFLDWDARQDVFVALAAVSMRRVTVMDPRAGSPEDLILLRATADFFDVLRFAPVVGRVFGREHEDEGRSKVIVLTHALWQQRYGGAPEVVGRIVSLDHEPYEVIGVLAPEAAYTGGSVRGAQAVVPYVIQPAERVRAAGVSTRYLSTLARLKPGTSLAQAQARMDQIASSLRAEHPAWNENHHVRVAPLLDEFVNSEWRQWLWLLLGAAGVTLLIACVNVALLQLARAATREHEMSVRASLGASRWRVIRQLLVENVLLAVMGTAAAVSVASAGVAVLKAAIPSAMPRLDEVHVDLRVLGVMTAVALVAGIGFGMAPALHLSGPQVALGLKTATRTMAGHSSRRGRHWLVATEVALAVVLLVGAALFVRTFQAVVSVDLGFDPTRVLTATVTRPSGPGTVVGASITMGTGSGGEPTNTAPLDELVDRVSAMPGVTSAAYAMPGGPLGGATFMGGIEILGRVLPDDPSIIVRRVTSDFHTALRIPLIEGRLLSSDDRADRPAVAVVNQSAVRVFFGGASPLGQTVTIGEVQHVIVGVVGDALQQLEEPVVPELNAPLWAGGRNLRGISGQLFVRTTSEPSAVVSLVKSITADVLPDMPLRAIGTLEQALDRMTAWRRFDMWLVSLFGVLGVIITAVGVYGTLAYSVERRTREIGVRMALGASPRAVLRLVLGETGRVVVAGLVAGGLGAWWLSSTVESYLFGVPARDPISFTVAMLTMATVALTAAAVPAWRAASVSPTVALRAE